MANSAEYRSCILNLCSRPATAALAMAIVFVLTQAATPSAQAQTYQLLYTFPGRLEGVNPVAGLTMDKAGNLYGTSNGGGITGGTCGNYGCGTVFKLTHFGIGLDFQHSLPLCWRR